MVSVASFAAILWNLSGPFTLFGVTLPKALFWIVLVYMLIATIVAFWIGHPLIRLSFLNELRNAAFRYALIRLKDAAEAVGFYRGEDAERQQLRSRYAGVVANYRSWLRRMMSFNGWNFTMTQAINPLPWIIQFPRLSTGQITFGGVQQSATAFDQHPGRTVVLPQLLRLLRDLPGGDHSVCTASSTRTSGPAPCRRCRARAARTAP